MFFEYVYKIIINGWQQLLMGVGYTLLIAITSTLIGLVIGLAIGVVRTIPLSKNKFVRFLQKAVNVLFSVYIEIFRGTPMMVQSMVIYWGYAFATKSTLPIIPCAIFIVSVNTGAYMAEIVRGGIISIDKGQFEGAYALGMTHFQAMIHVLIPQVMRNILPSVSNEFVINIKDTSVLSVIGVMELFFIGETIYKLTWQYFPTFTVICVIYLILTFTITRLVRFVEKKLSTDGNYTICGSQSDPRAEIKVKEGTNG